MQRLNIANPTRNTVYRDLDVQEGHTYVYEVRAVNTAGTESASATAQTTAADGIPPAVPLNVHAAAGPGAGEISVSWSPNSEGDLQGYLLYRFDSGTQTWIPLNITISRTATFVTVSNLAERADYKYALTAYDSQNESGLSASSTARPLVASPGAPVVTVHQVLLGLYGASAYMEWGGAGGDASVYSEFRVYKKEETLPSDRWELAFTAPVSHFPGDPNENQPPQDIFTPQWADPWPERCRVMQYVVSGVDNTGEETVDSSIYQTKRILVPQTPAVTTYRQGNQQYVTFTPQGFDGCATVGNGFVVAQWTLVVKKTGITTLDQYSGSGPITVTAPPSSQIWAYALKAVVQDVYETTDPNAPSLSTTFISADLCVDANGVVQPFDNWCDDLDGSQSVPPPLNPPSQGSGGTVGGPTSQNDGVWQDDQMRQSIVRHGGATRGAFDVPRQDGWQPTSEADWEIAKLGDEPQKGRDDATVLSTQESMPIPGTHASPPRCSQSVGPLPLEQTEPGASFTLFSSVMSFCPSLGSLNGPILGANLPATPLYPSPPQGDGWATFDFADLAVDVHADFRPEAGGINLVPLLISGGLTTDPDFATQFFSWDHLGSVRVITNEAGALLAESKFLPYGDEVASTLSSASDNTHRFTGHERDVSSGLDYMKARYFSPTLARFLATDPAASFVNAAQLGIASYAYAIGNPLLFKDPKGLSPIGTSVINETGCIECMDGYSSKSGSGGTATVTHETTTTQKDSAGNVTTTTTATTQTFSITQVVAVGLDWTNPGKIGSATAEAIAAGDSAGEVTAAIVKDGVRTLSAVCLVKAAVTIATAATADAAAGAAVVEGATGSGRAISVADGYVSVEGSPFKISEFYYNHLWETGRGAPFLQAQEVFETATMITPDRMAGFFSYTNSVMKMIYNPTTWEIWHLGPL